MAWEGLERANEYNFELIVASEQFLECFMSNYEEGHCTKGSLTILLEGELMIFFPYVSMNPYLRFGNFIP